jgi:hypothetical protein
MSRKEKAIINLVGDAFGARFELLLAKYERAFTAKENKEVDEEFKISDEEAAKDIIEMYDGTEKSINDAAEKIKKFIDIALKETTDSIKKTMNSVKSPITKKRKQTTNDGDKKGKRKK